MPGKRAFDEQLAALDGLKLLPPEECVAPLRKALQHRNNFVVSKAADLARTLGLPQLIPDLLTAFNRFFDDPVKNDPQCWAKNAISRALADLEHQEAASYLRGLHFIQHEPVWGGSSDTAATLRATCALALVQCRSLTEAELLRHFVDLLADKEKNCSRRSHQCDLANRSACVFPASATAGESGVRRARSSGRLL